MEILISQIGSEIKNPDFIKMKIKLIIDEARAGSGVDTLRSALEGIVSCIENPRTSCQEIIEYSYKTAMEALGEDV